MNPPTALPSIPAPLPQRIAEHLNAMPKPHRKRYQPTLLLECYNTLIKQAAVIKELKLRLGDPLGEDNRPLVVLDENIPQMINRVIDSQTREVDPEADAEHIHLWQACKADPAADSEAHKALDAFKACHEMEMQPCIIQQDRGDGGFYSIIHPATWAKFTDEYRRQFKTIIAPNPEAAPVDTKPKYQTCEGCGCSWIGDEPRCTQCVQKDVEEPAFVSSVDGDCEKHGPWMNKARCPKCQAETVAESSKS